MSGTSKILGYTIKQHTRSVSDSSIAKAAPVVYSSRVVSDVRRGDRNGPPDKARYL